MVLLIAYLRTSGLVSRCALKAAWSGADKRSADSQQVGLTPEQPTAFGTAESHPTE